MRFWCFASVVGISGAGFWLWVLVASMGWFGFGCGFLVVSGLCGAV